MADRRYKKNVFQGNPPLPKHLESPLSYGWTRGKVSQETGAQLFTLGQATMRCVLPEDNLLFDGWIIVIDKESLYQYTGDLGKITADVKQILLERRKI